MHPPSATAVKQQSVLIFYASSYHVYTLVLMAKLQLSFPFSIVILPGYENGQQHDATEFLNSIICEVGKERLYMQVHVCGYPRSVALCHTSPLEECTKIMSKAAGRCLMTTQLHTIAS